MIGTKYSQNFTNGNSFNPLVKIDMGIIKAVTRLSNEHIHYTVFLETYHQENQTAEGIPIFSFGYNTYTYIKESRVVCIIKDSDYTKVFIVGQTYDPNVIRGIGAAKPGELNISSDKNGIIGIGTGDGVQINAGDSRVTISPEAAKIYVGKDTNINLNPTQFGISLNNNENFSIKNGQSVLNASKGFKVFSEQGGIYLSSDSFSFTERTGAKPSYLITNSIHRLVGDEFLSLFSVYNFEVGSSKVKGKTNAVEWNVLQGSYSFKLTTGDFKIDMLNTLGAEFSLKIGPSDFTFSKLIFNKSSLNIEIDSTLIGKSTFMLGSNELKINLKSQFPLIVSETNIEIFTSKIFLKNKDITGFKTASFEISDGDLTLISASKAMGGKIKLDGEVEITGNLTVKGTTGVEVTVGDVKAVTVSLKNHKHASSIPGGPTPPLPG